MSPSDDVVGVKNSSRIDSCLSRGISMIPTRLSRLVDSVQKVMDDLAVFGQEEGAWCTLLRHSLLRLRLSGPRIDQGVPGDQEIGRARYCTEYSSSVPSNGRGCDWCALADAQPP